MFVRALHPFCGSTRPVSLPFALSVVRAGFPSPASDYQEELDLNALLVHHPAATFFVRVEGDSMRGAGIVSGDILVVDRAKEPQSGDVVLAILDGEFTVKRWIECPGKGGKLQAENPNYPPIVVTPERDFSIWGVVTYALHELRRSSCLP